MGCGTSATATLNGTVLSTWSNVTLNVDTGNIMVKTADGLETNTKFNLEREPETSRTQKLHFVEQKIGGTWDEVGDKVKFSCVDGPLMQKLWQEVGLDSPCDSQSTTASSVSNNSLQGPSKVYEEFLCNGVAEFKDQTFLMTGELDGTIHIVEKGSGEVVLTLWQSSGGLSLNFYSCLVDTKRFGMSAIPEQAEHRQNAFCGTRDRTVCGSIVKLQVKPEVLEKIPVPLFAMAVMYSSFDLNGMDC